MSTTQNTAGIRAHGKDLVDHGRRKARKARTIRKAPIRTSVPMVYPITADDGATIRAYSADLVTP